MRVYLANVEANSAHRFASPLFKDGSFEFIPIPENGGQTSGVRYSDLRSHYDPSRDLLPYVPPRLHDAVCHNDPEFETFTYGDNGETPMSSGLTGIQPGDALLFLAWLEPWADGKRAGGARVYLIGGLSVDYAEFVTSQSDRRGRFAKNAHAIRGDERFFGVAGSSRSRRFRCAVPLTRDISSKVFRAADGGPWRWGGGKSNLPTVLRDLVAEHSDADDAVLLASG